MVISLKIIIFSPYDFVYFSPVQASHCSTEVENLLPPNSRVKGYRQEHMKQNNYYSKIKVYFFH